MAAQVIPVLFLVATIERRVTGHRSPDRMWILIGEVVGIAFGFLVIAAGECAALHALVFDTTSELLERLTITGLGLAGLLVLVEGFVANLEAQLNRAANDHPSWAEDLHKLRELSNFGFGVLLVVGMGVYTGILMAMN